MLPLTARASGESCLRLQDPQHRVDRIPVSRCNRHTQGFVDLAEIRNRLHVAPIDAENELFFPSDDTHVPIVVRRDSERHRRQPSGHRSCKDTNEANVFPIHGDSLERRAALEGEHVRTLAQDHLRIERQTADQLRAKHLAEPGLRTTNRPVAPTLTTSKRCNSLATSEGRNRRCPPTFAPRKNATIAMPSHFALDAFAPSSLHSRFVLYSYRTGRLRQNTHCRRIYV